MPEIAVSLMDGCRWKLKKGSKSLLEVREAGLK
jgi:hypothetical protein